MGFYINDNLGEQIVKFLAKQGFAANQDPNYDVDIFSLEHPSFPKGMSADLEFNLRTCIEHHPDAGVGEDHDCGRPDYVLSVNAQFEGCAVDDNVLDRGFDTDSVEELQPMLDKFIIQCGEYCQPLHSQGSFLAIMYKNSIRRLEAVTRNSWSMGEDSQVQSFFYTSVPCPHRVDLVRPALETLNEYLTELTEGSK